MGSRMPETKLAYQISFLVCGTAQGGHPPDFSLWALMRFFVLQTINLFFSNFES
jgi:hypothetical protein